MRLTAWYTRIQASDDSHSVPYWHRGEWGSTTKVFVEWSLRRNVTSSNATLSNASFGRNFSLDSDAKINHGVDAILDTFVSWIVEIVGDNRSNSYKANITINWELNRKQNRLLIRIVHQIKYFRNLCYCCVLCVVIVSIKNGWLFNSKIL